MYLNVYGILVFGSIIVGFLKLILRKFDILIIFFVKFCSK